MTFKKRHPDIGARPGTLVVPQSLPDPKIRAIHYTASQIDEAELGTVAEIQKYLARDGLTWIDVQGLGSESVLREIAEVFSIHPLALEDVVNVPQRPKLELFEHHVFAVTRMARIVNGTLDSEQLSLFLSDRCVLTFQERYGDVLDPVRERLRQGKGPMRRSGPDYLAYAILDMVIDAYYPVLEWLSDDLERLEEAVIESPVPDTLREINEVKRTLLDLRRSIWPQRDLINTMIREHTSFVSDSVQVYLRDCYDHLVQLADVLETYRELIGALQSTYLSAISNRTNDIMKVLTILASIFVPLTFLAGIYGMNFENMPELKIRAAYPVLIVVMVIAAIGMLVYFRRLGWLGQQTTDTPGRPADPPRSGGTTDDHPPPGPGDG